LSGVLKDRWYWYIVLLVAVIVIVPFIVIYLVLLLPAIWGPAFFMVSLVIVWAVVSGYKDWVTARRKEDEEKKQATTA
jgi:uncharacterized membrane protein YhaH (DUF805 family)